MMEVIQKGRSGADLSRLIKNSRPGGQVGRDKRTEVGLAVESAEVNISKEAREPQRIAQQLARKGDKLLAEKVKQLKEIIAKGEYEVHPREVAKSIIRTEMFWHLEKSKFQSMNIDLRRLLARAEEEIAHGEKWWRNMQDQKKLVAALDVVALSQQIDAEPSLASSTFSSRRIRC